MKKVDYHGLLKYSEKVYKKSLLWSPKKRKYARDNIKAIESTYTG